jgi:hypothetical protein
MKQATKSWLNYYVGYAVTPGCESSVTKMKISGAKKDKSGKGNRVSKG